MSGTYPVEETIKYPSGQPGPTSINFFTLNTEEITTDIVQQSRVPQDGDNDFSNPLFAAIL